MAGTTKQHQHITHISTLANQHITHISTSAHQHPDVPQAPVGIFDISTSAY
jgi:hypothetical protein